MNTRVKELRKELKLTQKDFAKALGISKSTIESIEYGRREVSDRTFRDICRIFHVSEDWLRTGEGEMFQAPSREDEIAEMTSKMYHADDVDYRYNLMRILNQVSDENMEDLFNIAKAWVDEVMAAEAAQEAADENTDTQ